jgi:hypothetical protein
VVAAVYCCRMQSRLLACSAGCRLAQRPERRPDLGREQLGLFPGGEVAALVGLVEVGEVGYPFSTQLRGARKISPGNVVKPTGSETRGGACPAARAWARPLSQYDRAAEAPVPPSQYTVMLSRMWSRVRPPEGCRSTKAREIL